MGVIEFPAASKQSQTLHLLRCSVSGKSEEISSLQGHNSYVGLTFESPFKPTDRMAGSVEDDVMHIRKKIDKITEELKGGGGGGGSAGEALDLLKSLDSTKMDLNILTKTRIGMSVNVLRKSLSDDDVNSLAKSLIKAWKKFLPQDGDKKDSANGKNGSSSSSDKKKESSESSGGADNGAASGGGATPDFGKSFPPKPAATTDDVRLSCRSMLAKALKGEGQLPDGTVKCPEDLAEMIEDAIFRKFKSTNPKYKNQIRSRVFNLRDKKNPELRENVLCGTISEEICGDDIGADGI